VKMINNLSEELNILRPGMMETGLEAVAYNLNRKNNDLQFFEFGKTYAVIGQEKYTENDHLCIYITGNKTADGWKARGEKTDFYFLKAVFEKIIDILGLKINSYIQEEITGLSVSLRGKIKNETVASLGVVNNKMLDRFSIKQPVFYADLDWNKLMELSKQVKIQYGEVSKYPSVQRDLAIVVEKGLRFEEVEKATHAVKLNKLRSVNLFDIFESEKIGKGKKSMAISFTFLDEEKTLTDKEIDNMMSKIISSYEKELHADIRK
jgi:phenylalanyl-tRNA synthetase beta chain